MTREEDGLCCCEYLTYQGERAHLLGLCCDCEALDTMVDSLVKGGGVRGDKVREVLDTAEERLRLPWPGGAVRIPLSSTLPVILVPSLLWTASLHFVLAGVVFIVILPLLFLVTVRVIVKHKPKTKFFINWAAVTAVYLFYIYEVKAVGLFWDLPKLISWWENLVLVLGIAGTVWTSWRLKRDFLAFCDLGSVTSGGKMCRVCEVPVPGKDHHCVWLDLCIHKENIRMFLTFLVFSLLTTGQLALLLTSTACPGELLGPLLLPAPCWPDRDNDKLLLVSGLYSGLISTLLTILLSGQLCRQFRN